MPHGVTSQHQRSSAGAAAAHWYACSYTHPSKHTVEGCDTNQYSLREGYQEASLIGLIRSQGEMLLSNAFQWLTKEGGGPGWCLSSGSRDSMVAHILDCVMRDQL